MDQRKLMDNASTITDMAKVSEEGSESENGQQLIKGGARANAPSGKLLKFAATFIQALPAGGVVIKTLFQTQNSVYEVLSDVNSRQDIMDERIASMEDRMNSIQCSLDVLPDILTRSVNLFSPLFAGAVRTSLCHPWESCKVLFLHMKVCLS